MDSYDGPDIGRRRFLRTVGAAGGASAFPVGTGGSSAPGLLQTGDVEPIAYDERVDEDLYGEMASEIADLLETAIKEAEVCLRDLMNWVTDEISGLIDDLLTVWVHVVDMESDAEAAEEWAENCDEAESNLRADINDDDINNSNISLSDYDFPQGCNIDEDLLDELDSAGSSNSISTGVVSPAGPGSDISTSSVVVSGSSTGSETASDSTSSSGWRAMTDSSPVQVDFPDWDDVEDAGSTVRSLGSDAESKLRSEIGDLQEEVVDILEEWNPLDLLQEVADKVAELFERALPDAEDLFGSILGGGDGISFDVFSAFPGLDFDFEPEFGFPVLGDLADDEDDYEPLDPEDLYYVSDARATGHGIPSTGAGSGSGEAAGAAAGAASRRDVARDSTTNIRTADGASAEGEEPRPIVFENCYSTEQPVVAYPVEFSLDIDWIGSPEAEFWMGQVADDGAECLYFAYDLDAEAPVGVSELIDRAEEVYEELEELVESFATVLSDVLDCFELSDLTDPVVDRLNEVTLAQFENRMFTLASIVDTLDQELQERGDVDNFPYDLDVVGRHIMAVEAVLLEQYNQITWFDPKLTDTAYHVDRRMDDIRAAMDETPVHVDLEELQHAADDLQSKLRSIPTLDDDQHPGEMLLQAPRELRECAEEFRDGLEELVVRTADDVIEDVRTEIDDLLEDVEEFLDEYADSMLRTTEAIEEAVGERGGELSDGLLRELQNLEDALQNRTSEIVREFKPGLPTVGCYRCCVGWQPETSWRVQAADWIVDKIWGLVTWVWDFLVDSAEELYDGAQRLDSWFRDNFPCDSDIWYRITQLVLAIIIVVAIIFAGAKLGAGALLSSAAAGAYKIGKAVILRLLLNRTLWKQILKALWNSLHDCGLKTEPS